MFKQEDNFFSILMFKHLYWVSMLLLLIFITYLVVGFLFSIAFLAKGIQKTDDASKGTGIGFKLIIIPGILIFWPVLLNQWRKAK